MSTTKTKKQFTPEQKEAYKKQKELEMEEYYELYKDNLINYFMLSPSVVWKGYFFTPIRWFRLIIKEFYSFNFCLNYNFIIIYI